MTLSTDIAQAILDGFDKHYRLFRETSVNAKERFERGDWTAVRGAQRARIGMYDMRVSEAVEAVMQRFPDAGREEELWRRIKVFLESADETRSGEAIAEYGNAIRELASANIFPGDLLLKNFGVTRYGRVVFYDYDELCELTDCRFRRIPTPRNDDDEMSSDPWFTVDKNDVFPEQFPTFLVPPGPTRDMFMAVNADLADAGYWIAQQERVKAGIQDDLFPYTQDVRFSKRYA